MRRLVSDLAVNLLGVRAKYILLIISALIGLALLATVNIHLSGWFLWYLVPAGEIKVMASDEASILSPLAGNLVQPEVWQRAQELAANGRRLVVTQSADSYSIAVMPRNPWLGRERAALEQLLEANGWQAERVGLVVRAWQGDASWMAERTFFNALGRAYLNLLTRELTWRSDLLVYVRGGRLPFVLNDMYIAGRFNSAGNKFIMAAGPAFPGSISIKQEYEIKDIQIDRLEITLPSEILQKYLTGKEAVWNKMLRDKLGLVHSKPDILQEVLKNKGTIGVYNNGNKFALIVRGDTAQFLESAVKWAQEEESFFRPRRHAFRLPDKTIGYEMVPGEPREALNSAGEDGCRSPRTADVPLWLCANEQAASLATDKETALERLKTAKSSRWAVALGHDYIKRLNWQAIENVEAFGEGERAVVVMELK